MTFGLSLSLFLNFVFTRSEGSVACAVSPEPLLISDALCNELNSAEQYNLYYEFNSFHVVVRNCFELLVGSERGTCIKGLICPQMKIAFHKFLWLVYKKNE